MMKDTKYKRFQAERQIKLIEGESEVFYGARNGGLAIGRDNIERQSKKVLISEDREKNLYEGIRQQAITYMNDEKIHWWSMKNESNNEVTANILSSQVHCLNHLFAIRNDENSIKLLLNNATGIEFDKILPSLIDKDGFISFEFIYHNIDLLNEKYETRGEKCTSVDALIIAKKGNEKWLIPLEWKYTEAYEHEKMEYNYKRYIDMASHNSHLNSWGQLYRTEPFYELGRQSLLMEKIIEKYPDIADNYIHIVVVPAGNTEMIADAEKFHISLKEDAHDKFIIIDPSKFLEPLRKTYPDLYNYLNIRYWR